MFSTWKVSHISGMECIAPLVTIHLSIVTYSNLFFNAEKIKNVLLYIKNDHEYYKSRPENKILQYYAIQGSKIGFYHVSYIYSTLFAYILLPTVTLVIVSSNNSEFKNLPVVVDFGVDLQQYYYHLFIPAYMSMFMVVHVVASYDNTYMVYVQHTYALLSIVNYKLKTMHILDTNSFIDLKNDRLIEKYNNIELSSVDKEKIFRKLVLCIKEHQNAIEYANLVESLFSKSILVQLFCNVITLTIGGVETVTNLGVNTGNMTRFGALTFAQVIRIFVLCLPGQRLLNHSEELHAAVCETRWYIFPENCLNLYKFVLARSMILNKITAFNMAVMSMETFQMIIKTAMSYFTVLLSTT
ncbi:odorant receptor 13a-like isoform X1 [Frieseomelitta varia]|uniref:odorant receptor 13a-like isoform X1 n=1 Tax=Frieseomelitta varia TaxID=561572 RepID=UPI001CB67F19|nr:odorant receptor 13a-like isoform X1 [Frieseomelitta varia]